MLGSVEVLLGICWDITWANKMIGSVLALIVILNIVAYRAFSLLVENNGNGNVFYISHLQLKGLGIE